MSEDDPTAHEAGAGQEPIDVPHTQLSPDALQGVIEAFVLREGTDYGEREVTLERKIAQVRAQLENGDAHIFFDPETASIAIVQTPRSGRSG